MRSEFLGQLLWSIGKMRNIKSLKLKRARKLNIFLSNHERSYFFLYHYFEWLEPVRDLEDTLIEQNSYSHYIEYTPLFGHLCYKTWVFKRF